MKYTLIAVTLLLCTACQPAEDRDDKPVEPLTQPYAEKIKQLEQQDIERVENLDEKIEGEVEGGSG